MFKVDSLKAGVYILTLTRVGYLKKELKINLTEDYQSTYILKKDEKMLKSVTVVTRKELEPKVDRFIYTPNKILAEGSTAAELLRLVPLVMYDEKTNAISLIGRPGTKFILIGYFAPKYTTYFGAKGARCFGPKGATF